MLFLFLVVLAITLLFNSHFWYNFSSKKNPVRFLRFGICISIIITLGLFVAIENSTSKNEGFIDTIGSIAFFIIAGAGLTLFFWFINYYKGIWSKRKLILYLLSVVLVFGLTLFCIAILLFGLGMKYLQL